MTYNTGNPVPSVDVRDLYDNAENLDKFSNGPLDSYPDRLGVPRQSLQGIRNASQYVNLGPYASGLVFTSLNQVFSYDAGSGAEFYSPGPSIVFPYTTTGVGAAEIANFRNVGDAVLRQDLASPDGAGLSGFDDSVVYPVGTVGKELVDLNKSAVFSVTDFGAVLDGVTDDGPAIRLALDAIPTTGGVLTWPDGSQCKVVGTIFMPQRIPTLTVEGWGIVLQGNNSQIIGDGTSVIFESGTGSKSTVALGGASNWPLGDELPTTIHYNSRIEGFNFKTCGNAMKLKNWIQGCAVSSCYATDFTGSMLWTNRSFYLSQTDLTGRPFRNDRADLTPIFRHDGFNNTMSFTGVHGSGIGPDTFTHGTGIGFDGGVEGLVLGNGISFEGCKNGILLNSIVYSLDINGVYFEVCDAAIRSTAANLNNMNVDNCRFNACSTNITVDNWLNGSFGAGNDSQSGLVTLGNGCTNDVHLPSQSKSELTHSTWVAAPTGWTLPAGCQVHRNDIIFNSAVGFNSIWFRNNPNSSGLTGVVPLSYTGDCFNVGGIIPYCTVTGVGTGTLTIDTKIAWHPNLSAVRFDLLIAHSSNAVIAGVLSANSTIFRDDAVAGITITPSDNAGFLRLAFTGFGTITSFSGKVRVI